MEEDFAETHIVVVVIVVAAVIVIIVIVVVVATFCFKEGEAAPTGPGKGVAAPEEDDL
jgi:flagellar basal body-associated protein FliL